MKDEGLRIKCSEWSVVRWSAVQRGVECYVGGFHGVK